jgi:hypothetical protein
LLDDVIQDVAHGAEEQDAPAYVSTSQSLRPVVAGFEVSLSGRIWVSPEAAAPRCFGLRVPNGFGLSSDNPAAPGLPRNSTAATIHMSYHVLRNGAASQSRRDTRARMRQLKP